MEFVLELLSLDLLADVAEDLLSELLLLGVAAHNRIHQVGSSQFLDQHVERQVIAGKLSAGHVFEELVDLAHLFIAVRVLDDGQELGELNLP